MSKKLKRILAAVVAVVLLVGVAGAAYSTYISSKSVIYDGRREAFTSPGSDGEDLFVDLKDLMPGDALTQTIRVGVQNMDSDRVKIYMTAKNPNDDYNTLLSYEDPTDPNKGNWVDLSVDVGTVENVLNIRNADNTDVLVGVFTQNGTKEINVNLAISILAGNELSDLTAEVDWVFYAVEENDPTPPGPNPPDEPFVPSLETHKHINYIIGFDDGLSHPEANLTRAQAAGIFYRLLTDAALIEMWSTEPCYPDVPEDAWYFMYVATLTNGGILTGYPDGNFLPDQPITRAEFATMVARFDTRFGELETTVTFPDIQGEWYQESIEFAATCGYVHGYPDGNFLPEQYITRAEAAALINHCLERHVDEKGLEDVTGYINWPDNSDPNIWYYYEIIEAANYHDSERSNRTAEGLVFKTEDWTELHEPIDWEKIEQEWIQYLTGNKDFVTDR